MMKRTKSNPILTIFCVFQLLLLAAGSWTCVSCGHAYSRKVEECGNCGKTRDDWIRRQAPKELSWICGSNNPPNAKFPCGICVANPETGLTDPHLSATRLAAKTPIDNAERCKTCNNDRTESLAKAIDWLIDLFESYIACATKETVRDVHTCIDSAYDELNTLSGNRAGWLTVGVPQYMAHPISQLTVSQWLAAAHSVLAMGGITIGPSTNYDDETRYHQTKQPGTPLRGELAVVGYLNPPRLPLQLGPNSTAASLDSVLLATVLNGTRFNELHGHGQRDNHAAAIDIALRDSITIEAALRVVVQNNAPGGAGRVLHSTCLLYTSDAADEGLV